LCNELFEAKQRLITRAYKTFSPNSTLRKRLIRSGRYVRLLQVVILKRQKVIFYIYKKKTSRKTLIFIEKRLLVNFNVYKKEEFGFKSATAHNKE
jgi:hypothetical protein